MPFELDIQADLNITIDGATEIRISGTGGPILQVHLPDLQTAFSIWRRHESVFAPVLKRVSGPLKESPVRVEFLVDNTIVALLDADKGAGTISRLVGTYPVRPRLIAIIRKALSS